MATPRLANVISGGLITAAGIWIWFHTRDFPSLRDGHPGPALFPAILAIALILCGGALLIHGAHRPARLIAEGARLRPDPRSILNVLVVGFLGLLYPLFHSVIGFAPASAALIFGVAVLLRARAWLAAAVALGGTAVIYLAFTRLLGVPL